MTEDLPPTADPDDEHSDDASPRISRAERRERALHDVIRTLIRDLCFHRHGVQDAGGALPLEFRLSVCPQENWEVRFDPPLVEQIASQIDDALAQRGAFEQGHVYCFRCGHAACEHSTPPDALHVFRGYTQTGTPEWSELTQLLVDRKDERVDRLFADPPAVLSCMQLGSELRKEQFSTFGKASRTYAILGQVAAGYFRVPEDAARAHGAGKLALSLQAVETRGPRGDMQLKLNIVAGRFPPGSLLELLVTAWEARVGRIIAAAAEALEGLTRSVRAAHDGGQAAEARRQLGRVPAILTRLARALEQSGRQRLRRTHHAQQRRKQERPVHKAMDDVKTAADDALFFDEKHGTWVVCGKQGRAHAFSRAGKHVTSFVIQQGGAAFRLRTNRWRRMTADEITRFRGTQEETGAE